MSEVKPIIGVCMDMCPQNEIIMREKNFLLHDFEITKESELILYKERTNREKNKDPYRPKADKRKVVKQFSRSSAGQPMQSAEDLRPIKVLLKTTEYLLHKVITKENDPKKWNKVYDFVFDRLRAIRQDMIIQSLDDIQCLSILEQCIRFHIYSKYFFGDENIKLYDKHINETHLRECMQSLLKRYDCIQNTERTKFRPLFESIYLIYNLGTNEALLRYGRLPQTMKCHPMIQNSFQIGLNFINGLYFQTIQSIFSLKAPILALLGSTKLPELHSIAIRRLTFGYSSPNTRFPIRILSQWLCPFEKNLEKADKYIKELSLTYGLNIINDSIVFNKVLFDETAKPLSIRKWSQFEHIVTQISIPSLLRGRLDIHYIEE